MTSARGKYQDGSGVDPLNAKIDRVEYAITTARGIAQLDNGAVVIEVTADGAIQHLVIGADARQLSFDQLAAAIAHLHGKALADARAAVKSAVSEVKDDPRIRAAAESIADATLLPEPISPEPEDEDVDFDGPSVGTFLHEPFGRERRH